MADTNKTEMTLQEKLAAKEAELKEMTRKAREAEKALEDKETQLAEAAKAAAKAGSDPKRRVKVRVPVGPNGDREPITVRVNDYTAIVKRGVEVELPYYVAKMLQACFDADEKTAVTLSEMENRYASEAPAKA